MIDNYDNQQDEGSGWMVNHLPAILWDRRAYIIVSFLLILAVATVTAFAMPTLYRSSASLLVEPQDLPENLAQDPDSGAIAERIAKIREKVLSRSDLIALIQQNDLYPEDRETEPMSAIVERMRKDTTVGALLNDIGKSNANSVIAINLSFDYSDPPKARDVMQSYVSSILRIDSEIVEDRAALAVRFLQDQSTKLEEQIGTVESQITTLKARNGAALSGVGTTPFVDTGSYSAQIVALEAQNRELMREANKPSQRDTLIAAAETALAAARAQFSDRHPDVIAARERLESVRQAALDDRSVGPSAIGAQIQENMAAIASLRLAKNSALASANAAVLGQARAPAILETASQLENRANALREQLKSVSDNLSKAQNSSRMASEQRAARLSLVEPPNLPDEPESPNRPLIIGAGAFLGLIVGFISAMVAELVARPVRSPIQIESLNLPLLGIVPHFDVKPERVRWNPFKRRDVGFG